MIRADKGESFIITVALWDESSGQNASGKIVYYDVRDENDNPLTPTVSGILSETSLTTVSGIYRTTVSIDTSGEYICYARSEGFYSSTEEILINSENLYELTKANRNYNISVEDVVRTNSSGTPSQIARNVPLGSTDYIITLIKGDSDTTWSGTTVSGSTFAWYKTVMSDLPFRMGDNGL